jgi:hypothetical protein
MYRMSEMTDNVLSDTAIPDSYVNIDSAHRIIRSFNMTVAIDVTPYLVSVLE